MVKHTEMAIVDKYQYCSTFLTILITCALFNVLFVVIELTYTNEPLLLSQNTQQIIFHQLRLLSSAVSNARSRQKGLERSHAMYICNPFA